MKDNRPKYNIISQSAVSTRQSGSPNSSESQHDDENRADGLAPANDVDDDAFIHNQTTGRSALACVEMEDIYVQEAKFSQGDDGILSQWLCLSSWMKRILMTNVVDDNTALLLYRHLCRAGEDPGVDDGGLVMIKLSKLWLLSVIGIVFVHSLARWMGWEIDENYTLHDFIQYDFTTVLLDLLCFFFVGRLCNSSCRGIDCLFPWGILITLGSIYPSIANDFEFLRHSVTMYEIMCTWPFILFIYALGLVIMAIVFGVSLIRSHHRRKVLPSRIVEALALSCLFILPGATSNTFHLHHWFGMWFLGMQSNAPEWWARAFQAFALGSYINGIAVYGRDSVLGCQEAFYRSTNQECDFMQCYSTLNPENETEYKEFVAPDWRLCNAADLRTSINDTNQYES